MFLDFGFEALPLAPARYADEVGRQESLGNPKRLDKPKFIPRVSVSPLGTRTFNLPLRYQYDSHLSRSYCTTEETRYGNHTPPSRQPASLLVAHNIIQYPKRGQRYTVSRCIVKTRCRYYGYR